MIITATRSRLVAAALAIAGLALPLAASAQDVPSYAQPASASSDETITGRIASIDGTFNITVDDARGFSDNVALYQGTIINPTGLTLESGMDVTIEGYADGSQFVANEIDTPYQLSGPAPAPTYYGPGWWYPGFAYGYGPAFSVGIVFAGGNAWHAEHQPFHGSAWAGSDGHAYGPQPVSYAPPARRTTEPVRRAPAPAPAPQVRAQQPVAPAAPVNRVAYHPQPATPVIPRPAPVAQRIAPVTAPAAPRAFQPPAATAPVRPQAPPAQAFRPAAPAFRAPAPQMRQAPPAARAAAPRNDNGGGHRGH
ncbi:MAG TPA: hypothetical protein VMA36_06595 [Candidatus Limnocylindria bacterium]|nr:hypothetical protein [Candidatus Limnocylindria bacterium]